MRTDSLGPERASIEFKRRFLGDARGGNAVVVVVVARGHSRRRHGARRWMDVVALFVREGGVRVGGNNENRSPESCLLFEERLESTSQSDFFMRFAARIRFLVTPVYVNTRQTLEYCIVFVLYCILKIHVLYDADRLLGNYQPLILDQSARGKRSPVVVNLNDVVSQEEGLVFVVVMGIEVVFVIWLDAVIDVGKFFEFVLITRHDDGYGNRRR